MAKMTDEDILQVVLSEESDALNYHSLISEKRAKLLDYYNCRPFGDEQPGQSQVVTSDVSDVVEGMLPNLLRIFTQGKQIAVFDADRTNIEDEAEQKTQLANWVFLRQNNGVLILHDMFKDALLQYTGTVKIYWDEYDEVKTFKYEGLNDLELQVLQANPEIEIDEIEYVEEFEGSPRLYEVTAKSTKKKGKAGIVNIPPEDFVVARRARSFADAPFIGHRSPKTRSQLKEMGFDPKVIDELPVEDPWQLSNEKTSRYYDLQPFQQDLNVSNHSPNDEIFLGEYYMRIDVDGDGIAELWQIHIAGQQILGKEQVDEHPFAVCVPIPIPHRAIGTCPAEQVADLQFRKSTLERQMFNNIYNNNFPRLLANDRADLDDLLTPRTGGVGRVQGREPVTGSVEPIPVQPMAAEILQALEYTNTAREVRTGVTRYNQGLDTDSLNKTATGFKGIQDMSQMRIDLIARIFAETGVKDIFKKIVSICGKHQNEPMQIKALGKTIDIDPTAWAEPIDCRIDVGIGSGDRMEKISNLNFILQAQMGMMQQGLVLADQTKVYNTLDKLVTETGLKDVSRYFNNPEVPAETLFAQNQQLSQMVHVMQAQMQDPEIEKAKIKAQLQAQVDQNRAEAQIHKNELDSENQMRQFLLKQAQDFEQHRRDMAQQAYEFQQTMLAKFTEMDLKYNAEQNDIPGTAED